MVELKTKPTNSKVADFINTIDDSVKREDSKTIIDLMKQITGEDPVMWGTSIIGFGNIHLKYESGRELDWMRIGFSPRKQNLTLYILKDTPQFQHLLTQLGKHSTGKGCLYINKLTDINLDILKQLIQESYNS